MPSQYPQRRKAVPGQSQGSPQAQYFSIPQLSSDIKAMNSAILIISQKIEHLVRNEKILSRNIIVLNKRLKEIETSLQSGTGSVGEKAQQLEQRLSELSGQVARHTLALEETAAQLSSLESKFAPKSELQEVKYIVQAINPLEFVTSKQVSEMIDQKLGQKGSGQVQQSEGKNYEERQRKKK